MARQNPIHNNNKIPTEYDLPITLSICKTLVSASVSLFALCAAQEVVFVLNTSEVGAPTYNPIKANNLNKATTLIFDRMVS